MASKVIATILNLKDNFSKTIDKTTSNTKKFQNEIKKTQGNVKEMKTGITGAFSGIMGTIAKIGAAIGAGIGIKDVIQNAANAQKSIAQMDAVLKSTGGAAGMTKTQLLNLAAAQGRVTTYSKATNIETENMLLTFTGISKKVFPDVLKATNDMATAMGTDTKSAALTLGKALNDPATGLTKLTKQGVTFTAQQKAQVKAMVAAGNTAGAQAIMLKELQKEFGGSAEAAGKTFGGQITILKNNLVGLTTNIGMVLLPYLNNFVSFVNTHLPQIQAVAGNVTNFVGNKVKFVAGVLNNLTTNVIPKMQKNITGVVDSITKKLSSFGISAKEIKSILGTFSGLMLGVAGGFLIAGKAVSVFTKVHDLLKVSFLTSPVFWIAAGIAALAAGFMYAYKNCKPFRTEVNNILNKLKELGTHMLNVLLPVIKQVINWIKTSALPVIKQIINWIQTNIVPIITNVIGIILKIVIPAVTVIAGLLQQFYTNIIVPIANFLATVIPPAITVIMAIVGALWKNILAPLASFIMGVFMAAFSVALPVISVAFSVAFNVIGAIIKSITQILKGVIDFVAGVFTGNWSRAWNGIKEIFAGIWNGIKGIVKGVINGIIEGINHVISGVNNLASVKLPGILGGGSVGIHIPDIPTFALGTQYFKGGFAKINERGDGENVILPDGSKVITADRSKKENSRDGGIKIYLIVQGNMIGNEEYANEIGTIITNKIKLGLKNS